MYSPQFQQRNSFSWSGCAVGSGWVASVGLSLCCQKPSIFGQKCSNIGHLPPLTWYKVSPNIQGREIAQFPGHCFQFILEAWMRDPDQGPVPCSNAPGRAASTLTSK